MPNEQSQPAQPSQAPAPTPPAPAPRPEHARPDTGRYVERNEPAPGERRTK